MPEDLSATHAGHLTGRVILVVEDDRLTADELRHGLEEPGC